jgi:hypothetical protein
MTWVPKGLLSTNGSYRLTEILSRRHAQALPLIQVGHSTNCSCLAGNEVSVQEPIGLQLRR